MSLLSRTKPQREYQIFEMIDSLGETRRVRVHVMDGIEDYRAAGLVPVAAYQCLGFNKDRHREDVGDLLQDFYPTAEAKKELADLIASRKAANEEHQLRRHAASAQGRQMALAAASAKGAMEQLAQMVTAQQAAEPQAKKAHKPQV